ncbi:MAG: Uma2 family endonuclease [Pyrinomonadaceae bacterium]|nr:Uma2 family endonuclease [Pyrinomonadaceae bacterium]
MTSTKTVNWTQTIETVLETGEPMILYGVTWDDYKNLHKSLGVDRSGIKTSFSKGILKIMPKSATHENYAEVVKLMVHSVSMKLRQRVLFYGSATMEKTEKHKGVEPDACFFVSRANLVSGKKRFDIGDIPPDIVVEIDVFHLSDDKFEIYSAFGVKEFWLYDEKIVRIFALQDDGDYLIIEKSLELPVLTAEILTEYLKRSQTQDQFDVLTDFEIWLNAQK